MESFDLNEFYEYDREKQRRIIAEAEKMVEKLKGIAKPPRFDERYRITDHLVINVYDESLSTTLQYFEKMIPLDAMEQRYLTQLFADIEEERRQREKS